MCRSKTSYPASLEEHVSGRLELLLGSKPAYVQAHHLIQMFPLAHCFPPGLAFLGTSSWHQYHTAWEWPHGLQPSLPVTLTLEKMACLSCKTPIVGHLHFSQSNGGSSGATAQCTVWPMGAMQISLCWSSHYFPSVANICQEFLGNFQQPVLCNHPSIISTPLELYPLSGYHGSVGSAFSLSAQSLTVHSAELCLRVDPPLFSFFIGS